MRKNRRDTVVGQLEHSSIDRAGVQDGRLVLQLSEVCVCFLQTLFLQNEFLFEKKEKIKNQ